MEAIGKSVFLSGAFGSRPGAIHQWRACSFRELVTFMRRKRPFVVGPSALMVVTEARYILAQPALDIFRAVGEDIFASGPDDDFSMIPVNVAQIIEGAKFSKVHGLRRCAGCYLRWLNGDKLEVQRAALNLELSTRYPRLSVFVHADSNFAVFAKELNFAVPVVELEDDGVRSMVFHDESSKPFDSQVAAWGLCCGKDEMTGKFTSMVPDFGRSRMR